MANPGETTIIASLTKQSLSAVPQIKRIVLSAIVDDEALQYAYQQGIFNVRITQDAGLKLKIGLAAQVGAVLNLNEQAE